MRINGQVVSAQIFRPWQFVELLEGVDLRVAQVFHVRSPDGESIPFWSEDPEQPFRGMPLMSSMQPRVLGDYANVLAQPGNLQRFVMICTVLDDLPEPLLAVQVIRDLARRRLEADAAHVRASLQSVRASLQARRDVFLQVRARLRSLSAAAIRG